MHSKSMKFEFFASSVTRAKDEQWESALFDAIKPQINHVLGGGNAMIVVETPLAIIDSNAVREEDSNGILSHLIAYLFQVQEELLQREQDYSFGQSYCRHSFTIRQMETQLLSSLTDTGFGEDSSNVLLKHALKNIEVNMGKDAAYVIYSLELDSSFDGKGLCHGKISVVECYRNHLTESNQMMMYILTLPMLKNKVDVKDEVRNNVNDDVLVREHAIQHTIEESEAVEDSFVASRDTKKYHQSKLTINSDALNTHPPTTQAPEVSGTKADGVKEAGITTNEIHLLEEDSDWNEVLVELISGDENSDAVVTEEDSGEDPNCYTGEVDIFNNDLTKEEDEEDVEVDEVVWIGQGKLDDDGDVEETQQEEHHAENDLIICDRLYSSARSYFDEKKYNHALVTANACVSKRSDYYGAHSIPTLDVIHLLANIYYHQQDYLKAEEFAEECLTWRIHVLGEDAIESMESMHLLSMIYYDQMYYKIAKPWMQKCYETRKKVLGIHHADTLIAMKLLGWITYCEEDFLQAKVLGTAYLALGKHMADRVEILRLLAWTCFQLKQYEEAEKYIKEILMPCGDNSVTIDYKFNDVESMFSLLNNLIEKYECERKNMKKAKKLRKFRLHESRRMENIFGKKLESF